MIARLLSLALLVGQMGAAAHAYTHLNDDPLGLPDTAQGCRTCHSCTPLLSPVAGSDAVCLVTRGVADTVVPADAIPVSLDSHFPAFRSRAPPTLF